MRLAQALEARSWPEHLAWLARPAFVALFCVAFVREPSLRALLKSVIAACFIAGVAAKEMAEVPRMRRHALDAWRRAGLRAALPHVVTEALRGAVVTMLRLQIGAWRRLRGQPMPASMAPMDVSARSFDHLRGSGYATLLPLALLMAGVEVPVTQAILPLLGLPPSEALALRTLLALLSLLTVTSLFGDRWWLGRAVHVADVEALHLAVGVRTRGHLPWAAIDHAAPMPRGRFDGALWSRGEILAAPFGAPNVVLHLRTGPGAAAVVLEQWGVRFEAPRRVMLRVHDPHALVAEITRRTACGAMPPAVPVKA